MKAYLYVLVMAAGVTFVLTGLVRRAARRMGALTPVRDRDVHVVPIPRMGGVAIFLGFVVALITARQMPFLAPVFTAGVPWGILLGATAICALGVADDLWSLDAVTKLAGQTLAAGLMAIKGVQLIVIPVGGVTVLSPTILTAITVLIVVVTINAVNFIDGLDGLAAGVVGIAGLAFFVYSYLLSRSASPDNYSSMTSVITAALVGACIGFLPHNFYPARIFMGDSGSMLLGLLLATATITMTGNIDTTSVSQSSIIPAFLPLLLPVAVLAFPLSDLVMAVARRTWAGYKPWHPDKMHLHHRLLRLGHSHAQAVLILYMWTAVGAFGVVATAFVPVPVAIALVAMGIGVVIAITWRHRWFHVTTPPTPESVVS